MNQMNLITDIKGLKIGITGCSGVLGTRLIQILSLHDADITCLIRESSKIDHIRDLKPGFVYGDITDKNSLADFVRNIDICIHLAAFVGHGSVEDFRRVNVQGTRNLCEAIISDNPDCRLINCSSIAALRIKGKIKLEFTHYAKSKKMADNVVEEMIQEKGLKAVTIYPGLIYGPYDIKFIPTLIKNLENNKIFFLTGGEKDSPLIYIDDLCDLFLKVIVNKETVGRKYIGVGPGELGIHDVFKAIAKKLSLPEPTKRYPKFPYLVAAVIMESVYSFFRIKRPPTITRRIVDILSINFEVKRYKNDNKAVGWEPRVNFEQGLNSFIKWYSEYNKDFASKFSLKEESYEYA